MAKGRDPTPKVLIIPFAMGQYRHVFSADRRRDNSVATASI